MMKPKIEQIRDFGKAIAPIFIGLWLCGVVSYVFLNSILPQGNVPAAPEITFLNIGPCFGIEHDLVKALDARDPQYICADMEVEADFVFLELYVFNSANKNQVYVTGSTLSPGHIAFPIDPPLPPGKYVAWIRWARTGLASIEFEVVETKK